MLASRSPQRRAILEQLGVPFTVHAPEVEELRYGEPGSIAVENALRKARAVRGERVLVLGADTVVDLDGRALGKPRDAAEARAFIEALSGREHRVTSGAALVEAGRERSVSGSARVRFHPLRRDQVDAYVAEGEWRGRAGGYAIQGRGARLVAAIEGDYWAVVGLPVAELVRMDPDLLCPAEGVEAPS